MIHFFVFIALRQWALLYVEIFGCPCKFTLCIFFTVTLMHEMIKYHLNNWIIVSTCNLLRPPPNFIYIGWIFKNYELAWDDKYITLFMKLLRENERLQIINNLVLHSSNCILTWICVCETENEGSVDHPTLQLRVKVKGDTVRTSQYCITGLEVMKDNRRTSFGQVKVCLRV